jgi:hypothetical protein
MRIICPPCVNKYDSVVSRSLSIGWHWLVDLQELRVYLADISKRKKSRAKAAPPSLPRPANRPAQSRGIFAALRQSGLIIASGESVLASVCAATADDSNVQAAAADYCAVTRDQSHVWLAGFI